MLTTAIGVLLALGKSYADGKPGAIPLLLIGHGGWYGVTRSGRGAPPVGAGE